MARFVSLLVLVLIGNFARAADPAPLRLLFLGDNGHHQPAKRFAELAPVMKDRGIELTYTNDPRDLNSGTLAKYDGLIVYANIDRIEPDQATALLDYVAAGKGFIPLHCATYCFRNSDEVVALMGAQFLRHGTDTFRVMPTEAAAQHPLMKGYTGFESWDETYVHTKHNERDRTVLEYRQEGQSREPWTWVRTHSKGRVFYTAWGHDERTWLNPGFQNLVERGIRWSVGGDPTVVPAFADRPAMTPKRTDVKPFEYVEAKLPFYPPGKQWGVTAEPIAKMQKPLSAEESLKHFVTPVGFEVQLFASEPDIGKPIAMNFDELGRLWICETVDYPNNLQRPEQGHDRIRICEDTNGDGRADKFTVFAEQLSIPTAITIYRGGAIVQDGARTVYLKDTDGDGRADLRKVLITGWALADTHGGVNNFQFGLDNWYYGMQGYNNSEPILTNGRKITSFRQGFFRFKVEGAGEQTAVTDLEFLRSTNNNTWGLGLSEEGLVFGSTANGNPSEYMPIANRYYERVRGWSSSVLNGIAESNRFDPITENVRQVDHHGGFTAGAGHALYTARAWPREYWNRTAFVAEPTGHLIATFVITPNGAGFRSKNSWNILASDDEWSAPIMAEVGPDGQLWVLDWYNPIVQHNPTPTGYRTGRGNAYEIELRDKTHGRIYRVVHKSSPAQPSTKLDPQHPDQLVTELRNDNFLWRRHAQRLLVERGELDVLPQLIPLIHSPKADARRSDAAAVHALWTAKGLGVLDGKNQETLNALLASLDDPSPTVRRNAQFVLPRNIDVISNSRQPLVLLKDRDPQVRLAALLALSEFPPSELAGAMAAGFLVDGGVETDPLMRDALTMAAAAHDRFFLAASLATQKELSQDALAVSRRVAEHYARGNPSQSIGALLRVHAAHPKSAATREFLAGLAAGWPKDKPLALDDAIESSLVALVKEADASTQASVVSLASRWGTKKLEPFVAQITATFLATAANEKATDEARIAAAKQLIDFRRNDATVADELFRMITARTSPDLIQGLIDAIGLSESPAVGQKLVEQVSAFTPSAKGAALSVLMRRTEWATILVDGLEKGTVDLSDLTLDQKQALVSHPNRRIAARAKTLLSQGGGLPNPDRQKVIEELSPVVLRSADAAQGKEVFKKQCAKCHRHSGEGEQIGPDLTGMAVHPKIELLTHIIDPSRSVEGNFRMYMVSTADGLVLTGLLSSENKTAIELIDAEAKRHAILREDIEELAASKKSLMPDGFEKQVPAESIADLLEFLTQRGKYLPLSLDKVATVVTTKGMFNNEEAQVERLVFSDWSPKTFEGVPFLLIDPRGDRRPNAVMLNGAYGSIPPRMPRSVTLPCNAPIKAIHFLSGVSGWGFPAEPKGGVSMIVRLVYADGKQEDHPLVNGEHFADYIRRVDVPGSKFAFALRGQQIRYLAVIPNRAETVSQIELVKGPDRTAPVVMAVTLESP